MTPLLAHRIERFHAELTAAWGDVWALLESLRLAFENRSEGLFAPGPLSEMAARIEQAGRRLFLDAQEAYERRRPIWRWSAFPIRHLQRQRR